MSRSFPANILSCHYKTGQRSVPRGNEGTPTCLGQRKNYTSWNAPVIVFGDEIECVIYLEYFTWPVTITAADHNCAVYKVSTLFTDHHVAATPDRRISRTMLEWEPLVRRCVSLLCVVDVVHLSIFWARNGLPVRKKLTYTTNARTHTRTYARTHPHVTWWAAFWWTSLQ